MLLLLVAGVPPPPATVVTPSSVDLVAAVVTPNLAVGSVVLPSALVAVLVAPTAVAVVSGTVSVLAMNLILATTMPSTGVTIQPSDMTQRVGWVTITYESVDESYPSDWVYPLANLYPQN